MKCPSCFNELSETPLGPVRVDVCQGGCGGIWFDAFEMQKVVQLGQPIQNTLSVVQQRPNIQLDASRKRSCPRCPEIKLHRHFFSQRRQVQVDECPSCGGYWLDAGELTIVRQEMKEDSPNLSPQEATISSEFIRYLYRLKTSGRAAPTDLT